MQAATSVATLHAHASKGDADGVIVDLPFQVESRGRDIKRLHSIDSRSEDGFRKEVARQLQECNAAIERLPAQLVRTKARCAW